MEAPNANGDGDRVMRVDSEGVFLSWGAGLEAVFGYKEAEVIGRRVDLLVPKPLRARHWEGFNNAVARGRMRRPDKTFRSVGVHKDGRLIPFRSIDILEFGGDGSVVGVTAVILRQGWRSWLRRMTRAHPEYQRPAARL